MFMEALRAALLGGLPVALFTFLLVQWSVSSGRMERFSGSDKLPEQHRKRTKAAGKTRSESSEGWLADVLHHKLMSFGGGYYGTMAVLTYILIESIEIWQFVLSLADPQTWIERLGFDLLIDFFINTITNLVAAFIWFATLPEYFDVHDGWIWIAVTYGAYLLALRVTVEAGDTLWERMHRSLRKRN